MFLLSVSRLTSFSVLSCVSFLPSFSLLLFFSSIPCGIPALTAVHAQYNSSHRCSRLVLKLHTHKKTHLGQIHSHTRNRKQCHLYSTVSGFLASSFVFYMFFGVSPVPSVSRVSSVVPSVYF